jgi:hypothetical protein
MSAKEILARGGLIAVVCAIVGFNTLSPLLERPGANGAGRLAALTPPRPIAAGSVELLTASLPPRPISTASSVGTATAGTAPPPASPSAVQGGDVASIRSPGEESRGAAPSSAQTLQGAPIVAATEPARAERGARAKRRTHHGWRVRWPRSAPFSYNKQLAAH